MSRLAEKKVHQMDLFEWADRNEEEQKTKAAQTRKQAKLDSMMEKINGKYGNGTIRKGEE